VAEQIRGKRGYFDALARRGVEMPLAATDAGTSAACPLKRRPGDKEYRFRRARNRGLSLPSPSWGSDRPDIPKETKY